MHINWMSNAPWANTGYGNQTRTFAKRIQALGHNMALTAFYGLEGGTLNWDGIPVYPKGRETWGNDIGAAHARQLAGPEGKPILITLVDAWVLQPDTLQLHGVRWVPWFPVDMEPLPPPIKRSIKKAYRRIVFSRFAEKMVNDAGLDCYYVPHGIDTNVYKPIEDAKSKLRLPEDKYIVGTVAANKGTPSRKSFPEMVEAFAIFHARHPDSVLYIHSTRGEHGEGQGLNLPELCDFHGLEVGVDVLFPDQYQLLVGYSDEYMAGLYSAFDVFLLPSMGEGFGIPIVEAQACGTPVIVGDWTSMSELCLAGWKIPKECAHAMYTPMAAYQYLPDAAVIARYLEEAYQKGDRLGKMAVKRAALYDADRVTKKYWKPVLAEIERGLKAWQE